MKRSKQILWDEASWQPTTRPTIVAAANILQDGTLLIGVRHWDSNMRNQFQAKYGKSSFKYKWWHKALRRLVGLPVAPPGRGTEGQGFIDQFSRYYEREEAMLLAIANDQIIVPKHQMLSLSALHSEDLW